MVDPADWMGEAVHQSACFGMSGMRKRDGRSKDESGHERREDCRSHEHPPCCSLFAVTDLLPIYNFKTDRTQSGEWSSLLVRSLAFSQYSLSQYSLSLRRSRCTRQYQPTGDHTAAGSAGT